MRCALLAMAILLAACSEQVASEKEPPTSGVRLVERTAQAAQPQVTKYDDTQLLYAIQGLRQVIDALEARIAVLEGRQTGARDIQALSQRLGEVEQSIARIRGSSLGGSSSISSLKDCISEMLRAWNNEYQRPACPWL